MCVKRWWIVTFSHAFGASSMNLPTGSSSLSLPCSCRIKIAMAVNCLVTDPIRNLVSGVLAMPCSALAEPIALAEDGLAAVRHQHRAAEVLDLDARVHIFFKLRGQVAGRRRLGQPEEGKQHERAGKRGGSHARAPQWVLCTDFSYIFSVAVPQLFDQRLELSVREQDVKVGIGLERGEIGKAAFDRLAEVGGGQLEVEPAHRKGSIGNRGLAVADQHRLFHFFHCQLGQLGAGPALPESEPLFVGARGIGRLVKRTIDSGQMPEQLALRLALGQTCAVRRSQRRQRLQERAPRGAARRPGPALRLRPPPGS